MTRAAGLSKRMHRWSIVMYSLGAVCMATGGLLYGLMEQERAGKWDNDIQENVHVKEK